MYVHTVSGNNNEFYPGKATNNFIKTKKCLLEKYATVYLKRRAKLSDNDASQTLDESIGKKNCER